MQSKIKRYVAVLPLLLMPSAALVAAKPARNAGTDPNLVNFVRPGVVAKIKSAAIAKDGTITARVTIADPKGVPLDKDGVNTPGLVSLSFICAYIPAGKTQYFSYTTTTLNATINKNPPQIQAGNDSGGTFAKNGDGDYTYTFKTKAPTTFDGSATHAMGVSARRDLSEFIEQDEWAQVSNDVYTWIPNSGPVANPRQIASTGACNQCHNPLIGHGGSRLVVELCILCHTPQTVNPDTLLTQDMPVLIHKIHMGENLPSVKAGTPYRIWHRGAWSDFSTVAFPQDVRNCTVCHQGAPQADNWKTNPNRAACGACHDDVNFATGQGHVNLAQPNDNQCKQCHTQTASLDFDASIPGAHVVPNNSTSLPGIVLQVMKVENATPNNAPVVTFKVTDKSGVPVDISKLTQIRVVLAGPNVDYQTGPGGVRASEDPSKTTGSNGVYTYTMTTKIPAAAAGSYTVSLEARNTVTLLPGTQKATQATDSAIPVRTYFSVDKSAVVARRQVVSNEKCQACHADLKFVHGGTRGDTQECVMCHNPTLVDASGASANFAWQIHSIHRGEGLTKPYVLANNNYQEVRFPGDVRDCQSCHVNDSYQPDNVGAQAAVASPGASTPTTPPISAACFGCHDTQQAALHAQTNANSVGEACVVCHGKNAEFSMDNVHARQ